MKWRYSDLYKSKSGDISSQIKNLKVCDITLQMFLLNLELRENQKIKNRNEMETIEHPKKLIFK